MTTATKTKSTIHWAEGGAEYTKYPTKYTTKQLNNRLDFTGLEEKLSRVFGFHISIHGEMLEGYRGEKGTERVRLRSQNLLEYAGILGRVIKKLQIIDFSQSLQQHENGDIILNVGINFHWEFHKGGSNGHELFWAFYNFDKKEWAFNG